MRLLRRKLMEAKCELLFARKEAEKFGDEVIFNNALYGINKVLKLIEKEYPSAGALGEEKDAG
jgi:hypothetical protein